MKKIITTILFLLPLFIMAQTAPPIMQGSKYYKFRNALGIDSALFIPRKDTMFFDNTLKAPGMITWRPADSTLYMYRGDKWISVVQDSIDARNAISKSGQNVELGGALTKSTSIQLDDYNLRFTNVRPSFLEFKRTPSAAWDSAVGTVGALGSPEMNLAFNMDYTDAVHRAYDKTQACMWLALGGNVSALQYAFALPHINTDIWSASGGGYAWWVNTAKGYAQFAVNNNISHTAFDANFMVDRTANQSSISGYNDFVISGHRTKGVAGNVYITPYDTGRVYGATGGGSMSIGTLSPGEGRVMIARSGANPSITGENDLVIDGHRLKGVAGDIYLNAYNSGNILLGTGNGNVGVNMPVGGTLGTAKLTVFRDANDISISGNIDLVLDGNKTKGTAGSVLLNAYNTGNVYAATGGGNLNVGSLSGSGAKLYVAGTGDFTGGAVTLSNLTSNNLSLGSAGLGAPTFTTTSAGEKVKLYSAITGSTTNYGIGVETGNVWFSVPTTSQGYYFYGGTTRMLSLQGAGIGFGVSAPSAALHLIKTTEQIRSGFSATQYLSLTTDAVGATTINSVGTTPDVIFNTKSITVKDKTLPYTNPGAGSFVNFKDVNGVSMGAVGDISSQSSDIFLSNTIGTKTRFINMPDTASAGRAFSYISMQIDSNRNVSIGDTLDDARFSVTGTVKLDVPGAAKHDIYQRDSATGFLVPIAAGTYGQVLGYGPGGNPQPMSFVSAVPTIDDVTTAGNTTPNVVNVGSLGVANTSVLGGRIITNVRLVTSAGAVSASDHVVMVSNSADIILTLPTATSSDGVEYYFKKISNNANTITITPFGSELIEGAGTKVISTYNEHIKIVSYSNNWYIL